uniref:Secreted protein n=1 Tax=Glossina palpalis gambiensis TaxID=67801 RepID=A0A1B0BSK9_9MUSC
MISVTHTASVVLLLPLLLAVLRCGYAIPTGTPALRYISLVRCDKRLLLRFDLELKETVSSLFASVSKEFLSVVVAEVGGGGGGSNGDREDFRLVDGVGVVLALRDVEPDSLGLCLRLCLASSVKIRPSALTLPTLGAVNGKFVSLPHLQLRSLLCRVNKDWLALTLAESWLLCLSVTTWHCILHICGSSPVAGDANILGKEIDSVSIGSFCIVCCCWS